MVGFYCSLSLCRIRDLTRGRVYSKSPFKKNANFWVRVFALPAFIIYVLLYPIAGFCYSLKMASGSCWYSSLQHSRYRYGRVDLDAYVKQSIDDMSKEGEVDSEVKIFRNALDFTTTKLRDCMVPRPEIVAVSIDTDLETLKEKFIETGISRILVFKENIDDIVDIFICGKSLITRATGRTTWHRSRLYPKACRQTS